MACRQDHEIRQNMDSQSLMEGAGCLFFGAFEIYSFPHKYVVPFRKNNCYHLKASFWPQSAVTVVSWKPQLTLQPLFSPCLQKTSLQWRLWCVNLHAAFFLLALGHPSNTVNNASGLSVLIREDKADSYWRKL